MKYPILNRLTVGVFAVSIAATATSAIAEDPATGPVDNTVTSQSEIAPLEELSVSGLRALLYHSDGSGQAASAELALIGTGLFGAADIDILRMTGTPASLATLQAYDCVYVWANFVPPSAVAQGDRLKEYVDVGGGVVLSVYALSRNTGPWEMQGGIMGPGYSPLVNTATSLSSFPRTLDFGTADTASPLLAGVVDFTYGGNVNYGAATLDPGATLVGSDNSGVPLLALSSASDVAAINVYMPPNSFAKSPGVFRTWANACEAVSVLRVDIDIKPGSDPNSINLSSMGGVPVAIFGSASFDVTTIDTSTLSMADAGVKVVGKKNKELCSIEDVDSDGFDDLVCHFDTIDLGALDGTSTEATVKGNLQSGRAFEGVDAVNIVKE
jgi:hypothetical protein